MKFGFNQCTLRCVLSTLMGLFFLAFGAMKVMPLLNGDPQLTDMITQIFPVSGIILTLLAWAVVVTEVVGGLIVLGKKWAPKLLVRLSLFGFFVIALVGNTFLHIPSGDVGNIVMHVVIIFILAYLLCSYKSHCKK